MTHSFYISVGCIVHCIELYSTPTYLRLTQMCTDRFVDKQLSCSARLSYVTHFLLRNIWLLEQAFLSVSHICSICNFLCRSQSWPPAKDHRAPGDGHPTRTRRTVKRSGLTRSGNFSTDYLDSAGVNLLQYTV